MNKLTNEKFLIKVKNLVGDEYTFLEEYKGTKVKIKVRHNCDLCNNYEYEVTPNGFLSGGNRCPHEKCFNKRMSEIQKEKIKNKQNNIECKINKRKTNKQFLKEVNDLVGDEYTFLEEYKLNNIKIKVRHNCEKCNNYEYEVTPVMFLRGSRCPKCSKTNLKNSKAMLFIEKYFKINNIRYEKEIYFEDCKNIYGEKRKVKLPFDYKIYNEDNSWFLLEYDGGQHEKGWKNNKESKIKIQQKDMLKNIFCLKNKIILYRIKEKSLKELLNELNLIFERSTTIETMNDVNHTEGSRVEPSGEGNK